MTVKSVLFLVITPILLASVIKAPTHACGKVVAQQDSTGKVKPEKPEITDLAFGRITVNGRVFNKDVVIEKGRVRERKKGPSKSRRSEFAHTPLTPLEDIPWTCQTLVIGTGMQGRLPVVREFKEEAERRRVKLVILKTPQAVKYFLDHYGGPMNAVFHITC